MILRRALFLFVFVLSSYRAALPQAKPVHPEMRAADVAILWNDLAVREDSIDQQSYAETVVSMGFAPARLAPKNLQSARLGRGTLLLVPCASARMLPDSQARWILSGVERGLDLVTDGESPLSTALNIRLGEAEPVGVVIDKSLPQNHLHWADEPEVNWIVDTLNPQLKVLYADSAKGHALVGSGNLGKGKFLYLASHLDAVSGEGYSRFPTLVNALKRELGIRPPFRRQGVDAYFDPGYRSKIPTEDLPLLWRKWGIRAVHAAAWYYDGPKPFDYRRLIDAAHKNGILVYAWLEWPHIGEGFWKKHPEWRQKTALLQDANLDWLKLMDLQNPDCLREALGTLALELELDWDGVDIAEFTITGAGGEALEGPERPDYFVSFGKPMRTEFEKVGGFDPLELENPNSKHFWKRDSVGLERFYRYRTTVNNRLLRQVVEFIVEVGKKGKRDWELIHTIVDNSLHPEFNRLLGFDQKTTLALLKEYGVTLNVEDPFMEWENPPSRYHRLRETLMALVPDRRSMIDINVVPIHPVTQDGFASEQATGIELLQQLQAAAERGGRVCVYCESSLFESDWTLVPYAMAGGASMKRTGTEWEVKTPTTVTLNAVVRGMAVLLDGKPWPCFGSGGIVLPSGNHRLSIRAKTTSEMSSEQELRLVAISDELLECRSTKAGIDVRYISPARCALTLTLPPRKFLLDGSPIDLPVLQAGKRNVVLAPSGEHLLSITK